MFRKLCCLLLAWALVLETGELPAAAQAKEESLERRVARMKEAIARVGASEESRVAVALFDKSFYHGYVSEADEDWFVVTNPDGGTRVRVGYDEVRRLRAENAATGVKVSVPKERGKALNGVLRTVTLGIAGRKRVETSTNSYLSKPAIVVLVVLAVGLILIGVELKKS